MNDDISGWNDWSETFSDWSDISISELHGIVSAIMTVCDAPNETTWAKIFEEISLSTVSAPALTLVTEEAEDISFQLKDRDDAYAYVPLVPDDEHELHERVMALKNWASGYITGIGISDCQLTELELQSIADLSKIASIRISPEDEFEGGEESYLHLFEFVRMIPVSLSTRKRKTANELRLLVGLSIHDKTASELNNDGNYQENSYQGEVYQEEEAYQEDSYQEGSNALLVDTTQTSAKPH